MVFLTSRKTLFFVFSVFIAGSIYRAIHFATTGFFVPDEWAYSSVHLGDVTYQGRQFFNLFNSFVLPRGVDNLILAMPFYFMFWLSLGLLSAYGAMKLLGHEDWTIAITLLLSLTIPVFLLFSVTILTEPVAFAMTMLGIYLTIWFIKKGNSRIRYLAPVIAALCFVAADYTRVDFIIFQALGFVPFVVAETRRTKNLLQIATVFSLFIIPALFFFFYPSDSASGTAQAISSVITETSQPTGNVMTAVVNGTTYILKNITVNGITYTIRVLPTGNIFVNFARVVGVGIFLGFNPVIGIIITASALFMLYLFFKKPSETLPAFWLGFLGLATLGAAAYIYMVVPDLPLSTIIRYSYDALPAYFMLTPFLLARIKRENIYGFMLFGLILSGGIGGLSYQSALQSNLGGSYPYLNGSQSFLTLDYRTPYALLRDYFHSLPPQTFNIIGEPKHGYFNMSYNWQFTPGVSDIKVNFYPYSQLRFHNLTNFYLYVEPPNSGLQVPDGKYSVIFDSYSLYFAKVALP